MKKIAKKFEIPLLLAHQGQFKAAEEKMRKLLKDPLIQKEQSNWIHYQQILGNLLLEQAHYARALRVFESCFEFHKKQSDLFGQAMVCLSLAQVFSGLGMNSQAEQALEKARKSFSKTEQKELDPFLKFLRGKLEIAQGQMGAALRTLQEAVQGFENNQDMSGKVEVLLTMAAPLMEHQLIQEAQKLMNLLSDWKELNKFPALEHSVKLRRLSLSAFSGQFRPEDLALVKQDPWQLGRVEDWLQFWLHFTLAAKKLNRDDLFLLFSKRALGMVSKMESTLSVDQKQSFERRPDVARILRLGREQEKAAEAVVQAKVESLEKTTAEAASLAPPASKARHKK